MPEGTSYKVASDDATLRFDADIFVKSITEMKAEPVSEDFLTRAVLERIPLLRDFLEAGTGAGTTLGDLVSTKQVATGFHIGSVALSAMDLVRVPLFYLAAYIMGQKAPPFKLSDSVKLLYSASVVGVGVAALLVPAIVPILLTALGAVGVGLGVMGLVQLYRDRAATKAQLESVKIAIKKMELDIKPLQDETKALKKEFDAIMNDNEKPFSKRREEASIYLSKLNDLNTQFDLLYRPNLQDLLNKEVQYEAKLNEMKSPFAALDKTVGLVLGTVALAGAITLFFFPPVGLALLATSAILGGTYVLGRVGIPLVKKLWAWIKDKVSPQQSKEGINKEQSKEVINKDTVALGPTSTLESERSPDVLLQQISDPLKKNKGVAVEARAEAERLQSMSPPMSPPMSPRSSHVALTPLTLNSSVGDTDSRFSNTPSQGTMHTQAEFKKVETRLREKGKQDPDADKERLDDDEDDRDSEGLN